MSRSATARGLKVNATIAVTGVLAFHLLTLVSGRITESRGLGYDGLRYTRMVEGALSDGTANTSVRPFVILLVRIPHALGLDVIQSFQVVNYLAAFLLYLVLALLLARGGVGVPARVVLLLNLSLAIATSKMFAFYPTLIDLGAMAVISTAFYFAATDRALPAGVACVAAAASREFGLAVPLFGIHRSIRRRQWRNVLFYLPSLAVPFVIRMDALHIVPTGQQPFTAGALAGNLELWTRWPFVVAFAYFSLTVFGGITVLLWLRPLRMAATMRREPELATFVGFIVLAAAVGDADIWRYLAYILPGAMVFAAAALQDLDNETQRRALVTVTLITLLTQRPFQLMTMETYFTDWFPLYRASEANAVPALVATWGPRLAAVLLACAGLHLALRRPSPELGA